MELCTNSYLNKEYSHKCYREPSTSFGLYLYALEFPTKIIFISLPLFTSCIQVLLAENLSDSDWSPRIWTKPTCWLHPDPLDLLTLLDQTILDEYKLLDESNMYRTVPRATKFVTVWSCLVSCTSGKTSECSATVQGIRHDHVEIGISLFPNRNFLNENVVTTGYWLTQGQGARIARQN